MAIKFHAKALSTTALVALGVVTGACQVKTDHLAIHVNDRVGAQENASIVLASAATTTSKATTSKTTAGDAPTEGGQSASPGGDQTSDQSSPDQSSPGQSSPDQSSRGQSSPDQSSPGQSDTSSSTATSGALAESAAAAFSSGATQPTQQRSMVGRSTDQGPDGAKRVTTFYSDGSYHTETTDKNGQISGRAVGPKTGSVTP